MKRLNLCLHAGAHKVDLSEVIAAPTPERTDTHVPIPHIELINKVVQSLPNYGFNVVNQEHALMADGQRYFGLFQVENNQADADYSLVFGLRNSHDKKFPAGLCVGSGVFVCDNLAFSSEVKVARKHTVYILRDLPGLVTRALGKLTNLREKQDARIAAYKAYEMSQKDAHDFLIRAMAQKVIGATKIPRVLDMYNNPPHEEFKAGHTGWRMFNAFTEVLKESNLENLTKVTTALHGLLDLECGIIDAQYRILDNETAGE